jgi:hypothetical protein
MTTNKSPLAPMDVPAVRDARIELRLAELKVMAAQTAVEFWREQRQHGLASLRLQELVRSAMRRGRIDPTRRLP